MHLRDSINKQMQVDRYKMIKIDILKREFQSRGGILKTAELKDQGFSNNQMKRLHYKKAVQMYLV